MKTFGVVTLAAAACAVVLSALPAQAQMADGQVHVYLISSNGKTEITKGQPAESVNPDKPNALSMFLPIVPSTMKVHTQFGVQGTHATTVTTQSPVFEIKIPSGGVVDPAHFTPALIRLRVDGNRRLIDTQTTTSHIRTGMNTVDPLADERAQSTVQNLGAGRYRITPAQPLPPGEYAVAMRDPDVQPVTYSSTGQSAQRTSKQQIYQGWAWDFSVSAAPQ